MSNVHPSQNILLRKKKKKEEIFDIYLLTLLLFWLCSFFFFFFFFFFFLHVHTREGRGIRIRDLRFIRRSPSRLSYLLGITTLCSYSLISGTIHDTPIYKRIRADKFGNQIKII
jgi:hypothetical protein